MGDDEISFKIGLQSGQAEVNHALASISKAHTFSLVEKDGFGGMVERKREDHGNERGEGVSGVGG